MQASVKIGMKDPNRACGAQDPMPTEYSSTTYEEQERTFGPRPGQRVFGLREAAIYLGCSERTVRDLILDGEIPQVSLTSRIQVDVKDLDALIEKKKKVHAY